MKPNRDGKQLQVFLLGLVIIVATFTYTVHIRQAWFGSLAEPSHEWLTASTVKFATNWYREGALNLNFVMYEDIKSIENLEKDRELYPSYPPGTVVPIFLISKIMGSEPSVNLVMAYNLLNHVLISIIIFSVLFFLGKTSGISRHSTTTFSLLAACSYLLLPVPLYWHQNVFFSDQAILLPFIAYIALELSEKRDSSKSLRLIQHTVACWGILTDWLFFFVLLSVYLKRILTQEISIGNSSFLKQSTKFWIAPTVSISLFFYQVLNLDADTTLWNRFDERSGLFLDDGRYNFLSFSKQYWLQTLNPVITTLLLGSVLCVIITYIFRNKLGIRNSEGLKKILIAAFLILMPCVLQTYMFRNHSLQHSFSVLKYYLAFVLITFALLPFAMSFVAAGLERLMKQKTSRFSQIVTVAFALLFSMVVMKLHMNYHIIFQKPGRDHGLARFIGAHTDFNDVVFAKSYQITNMPPQKIAFSKKQVHRIESLDEIRAIIQPTPAKAVVNLLMTKNEIVESNLQSLAALSFKTVSYKDYDLLKISKSAWESELASLSVYGEKSISTE